MNKIKDTLKKLGIMPNVKGYHYLATAIELCAIEFRNKQPVESWMSLYRVVAVRHNEGNPGNVERCIRSAIEKAYRSDFWKEIIHDDSNSAFIALVAEYIMEEEING